MKEKHKKIGKMSIKSNEPMSSHKVSPVSGINYATDQRKLGSANSILQVVSRLV